MMRNTLWTANDVPLSVEYWAEGGADNFTHLVIVAEGANTVCQLNTKTPGMMQIGKRKTVSCSVCDFVRKSIQEGAEAWLGK